MNSTDTAEEEPTERNGVQMTQLEPGLNLPQGYLYTQDSQLSEPTHSLFVPEPGWVGLGFLKLALHKACVISNILWLEGSSDIHKVQWFSNHWFSNHISVLGKEFAFHFEFRRVSLKGFKQANLCFKTKSYAVSVHNTFGMLKNGVRKTKFRGHWVLQVRINEG